MGRRDAVQVTLEFVAEWRRLGAHVTFEPGWERRGNGLQANYEGCSVHHTGFGSSATNPFPGKNTLIGGRPDLPGPLCNSAGPRHPDDLPWIHVIAAFPANHGGASGGRGTAPFPVTSLFNPLSWGHETDYGGNVPMSAGQYVGALIVARGVCNVLRKDVSWAKAHAETSVTGKWDPGYAPGKTIDMAAFRREAASPSLIAEDFMSALSENEQRELLENTRALVGGVAGLRPAGEVYIDVKATRAAAETAAFAVTPGEAGKRPAGAMYAANAALQGQVVGLQSALQAVAKAPGSAVDLGAVFDAAKAGAAEALAQGVNVDVTVGGKPATA